MTCKGLSRQQMINRINEVCFAVDDILLFLDTHPCDEKAMEFYHMAAKERRELMKEYAENFGPLTVDDALFSDSKTWKWMEEPFPWEKKGGCK